MVRQGGGRGREFEEEGNRRLKMKKGRNSCGFNLNLRLTTNDVREGKPPSIAQVLKGGKSVRKGMGITSHGKKERKDNHQATSGNYDFTGDGERKDRRENDENSFFQK